MSSRVGNAENRADRYAPTPATLADRNHDEAAAFIQSLRTEVRPDEGSDQLRALLAIAHALLAIDSRLEDMHERIP